MLVSGGSELLFDCFCFGKKIDARAEGMFNK